MYADQTTPAMAAAINETDRRRDKQEAFNLENGIEPQQIVKDIQDITDRLRSVEGEDKEDAPALDEGLLGLPADELEKMIEELEKEMQKAAQALEFEKAAALRDQVFDLRSSLVVAGGAEGDLLLT